MNAEERSLGFSPQDPQLADLELLLGRVEAGEQDPAELALAPLVAVWQRVGHLETASAALVLLTRLATRKAAALLPEPPVKPGQSGEVADGGVEPEGMEEGWLAEQVARFQSFAEVREVLRRLEERRRERFARPASAAPEAAPQTASGEPTLEELLRAFRAVWERAGSRTAEVGRETITVRQAVQRLRALVAERRELAFEALFPERADRTEVVTTFLALLELVRLGEVAVWQSEPFGPLWLRAIGRPADSRRPERVSTGS